MYKRIVSLFLCVMMLLGIALPVYADETENGEEQVFTELKISTPDEFLAFAENCRLDSYSRDLSVTLEKDIDLNGVEFQSVPIFNGIFDGKGHTVSGLSITGDGSTLGLFRYLTATAVVRNLNVKGEIHPNGSRNKIGAIAGQNEGLIYNCSVAGSISGGDYVGGIVGINMVTGIVEKCKVSGDVHGDHFVGGIAGENSGVIRNCSSSAQINTTPQQNSVEISDITMDSLTNTEAANTVTDIGGIAGISSGVIRDCENLGDVGYRHMGYNIGGIAGTQSGYIAGCENHGSIQGRKEVGGVVGQMEPISWIEYSEDTLQILQGQLGTMSGLVNQASGNAQNNAKKINNQIGVLQGQTQTAREAVAALIPDVNNPEIPDPDAVLAAQNTLSATLGAMPGTVRGIASATQETVNGLSRDLNAISGQISAMSATINGASENLGGSITDISDLDTPDALIGKVDGCINYGYILADLNAGGVAGAMAMENDLDILEDLELRGEESMNFESEVRAVILNCENQGTVVGKKQNVGGIAGWQSLGLVKGCTNTGKVEGENADYVGGISGMSTGYIRSNHAKCEIIAGTYAGGIAGSATVVTDCITMVKIENSSEKLGAVLGEAVESKTQDEEIPVSGNIYPLVSRDMGAIDGISYAGLAEPMALDAFLAMENLPEMFSSVTVRFLFANGTEERISVRPGGSLPANRIPEIPEKEGFTGKWEGLESADLGNVVFDMTFAVAYVPHRTTMQSQQTRENGLPLILVEGAFDEDAAVVIDQSDAAPVLSGNETMLESWTVAMTQPVKTVRFLLPVDVDAETVKLLICDAQGTWQTVPCYVDGSYLVFEMNQKITGIALVEAAGNNLVLYGIVIGAALILTVPVIRHCRKKRGSESAESKENMSLDS